MQSADCLMPSQSAKAVLLCQGGGGELGGCGQLTVYFLNFLHLLVGKHVDHSCHLSVLSLCVFPASVGGTPASFLSLCLGAALAFAFLLLSVGLVLSGRECDFLSPLSGQRWSRAPCLQGSACVPHSRGVGLPSLHSVNICPRCHPFHHGVFPLPSSLLSHSRKSREMTSSSPNTSI